MLFPAENQEKSNAQQPLTSSEEFLIHEKCMKRKNNFLAKVTKATNKQRTVAGHRSKNN
jgi:hypothetical protein